MNRNKKSVVIDLASDAGRALLLRLLDNADVLIDNFKTGTLKKIQALAMRRCLKTSSRA